MHSTKHLLALALLSLLSTSALAQSSVDWYSINAGSETLSGGNFQLSGTIAQIDADPLHPASGGNFALTGGFWVIGSTAEIGPDAIFRDGFE
jgi:hypothetical protein